MVGDEIKIQSFSGRVVKIGIRTTVIKSENGDNIFVPNSIFITTPVVRKAIEKDVHEEPEEQN